MAPSAQHLPVALLPEQPGDSAVRLYVVQLCARLPAADSTDRVPHHECSAENAESFVIPIQYAVIVLTSHADRVLCTVTAARDRVAPTHGAAAFTVRC